MIGNLCYMLHDVFRGKTMSFMNNKSTPNPMNFEIYVIKKCIYSWKFWCVTCHYLYKNESFQRIWKNILRRFSKVRHYRARRLYLHTTYLVVEILVFRQYHGPVFFSQMHHHFLRPCWSMTATIRMCDNIVNYIW